MIVRSMIILVYIVFDNIPRLNVADSIDDGIVGLEKKNVMNAFITNNNIAITIGEMMTGYWRSSEKETFGFHKKEMYFPFLIYAFSMTITSYNYFFDLFIHFEIEKTLSFIMPYYG